MEPKEIAVKMFVDRLGIKVDIKRNFDLSDEEGLAVFECRLSREFRKASGETYKVTTFNAHTFRNVGEDLPFPTDYEVVYGMAGAVFNLFTMTGLDQETACHFQGLGEMLATIMSQDEFHELLDIFGQWRKVA